MYFKECYNGNEKNRGEELVKRYGKLILKDRIYDN